MTEPERKREVKEVIIQAQKNVAEIKIFYGQISKNNQSQTSEKNEIEATISGSIDRLKRLGVSQEEIDKIDFNQNDQIAKFIIWCNENKLNPKDYKSLERYQKEVGIS
jgi:hypothetical protein